MADFGPGNRSFHSTTLGVTTNPTTSALIAAIDSTVVDGFVPAGARPVLATWLLGASTNVTWALEQALSTGLDMSTAGRSQVVVFTASNQTAQYVTRHVVEPGDQFRCRVLSTFTGNAGAKIIIEPLV
jgi:hypothetical protein